MNAATIVKLVVDRVLALLHSEISREVGNDFAEHVKARVREIVDQAIIELKFAEMELQVAKTDFERMIQKEEEAQALARGRANAIPNVEIVPPDDGEKK